MKKIVILSLVFMFGWSLTYAMPKVGDKAPDFTLPDQENVQHTLSKYQDSYVALYFYPKDDTPGCTAQACSLRDGFSALKEAGVVVLGVSFDDPASHKKFKEKHTLPFTLLSDTEKKVAELYDVKGMMWAKRVTFLIAPGGKVVHIFDKVDTSKHAEQILEVLKSLKK